MSGRTTGSVWTVVVAAGSGTRFGGPKQFLDLDGVRVVDRSIATAARHSDGIVLVTPSEPVPDVVAVTGPAGVEFHSVSGADTRAGSVRRGLTAVPTDAAVILVHDAARPLASDAVYERVIAAVRSGADAVAPVVPVTDTLRRRVGGVVDRDDVIAVQTPQGFSADALRRAHASGQEATDDVTVVENHGGTVVVVDGDRRNIKLTTPLDMDIASVLLRGDDE
ncbi:MAG: IspD/TarI family cytidylyltransferase [Acidimicrobiales bacterium]